ncbi:hypothetical protein [Streptomyces durocortorensis]|uniref:Secreted protein n=1 Tax=Streptomyces durocortorensis TaxID=2811104 RepID=A0ABS2HMN7_9ACTN|nr:hypothetical protein [Streptomyces durocortorensis]
MFRGFLALQGVIGTRLVAPERRCLAAMRRAPIQGGISPRRCEFDGGQRCRVTADGKLLQQHFALLLVDAHRGLGDGL